MGPESQEFLNRFDSFYKVMAEAAEKGKINERDFYSIIRAKCKSMEKERRELLNNNKIKA